MKRLFGSFAARLGLVAAVFSGMFLIGCADDSGSPEDNPVTPGGKSNPLVLGAGSAWVTSETESGETIGYVFSSDGTYKQIYSSTGFWVPSRDYGTYTTKSDSLTMIRAYDDGDYDTTKQTYTITGTKLTLTTEYGYSMVFTKTSVTVYDPSNPGGGNLVLPKGQAWTLDAGRGDIMGLLFQSDNSVSLFYGEGGIWELQYEGTYSTSGKGNITITFDDDPATGTYSVSGNNLMLTLDRRTMVFGKTSGINSFYDPSNPGGGELVLPEGQAWATGTSSSEHREGYIFLPDGTVYDLDYGYDDEDPNAWRIELQGTYTMGEPGYVLIDWGWEPGPDEVPYVMPYTVFNGTTLRFDGRTFTVATGVDIPQPPVVPALSKSTAGKQKGITRPAAKSLGWFAKK